MKKLIFGALALSLMFSVVSCRQNESENTEETVEDTAINQEAPADMTEEVESEEIADTTAVMDSIETPEQDSQIEE